MPAQKWKWTLHRKVADDRKAEAGASWVNYIARVNNRAMTGTVYHLSYCPSEGRYAKGSHMAELEKTPYCDEILDAIETDAEGSAD